MSSITPVLLFAVATFSTCTPSPSTPSPGGGSTGGGTSGGTVTLPAWTTGAVDADPDVAGVVTLVDVRHGTHDGFDRVVFEFEQGLPGYHVEYVDKPTWECGSGEEIWLDGDAWLRVDLEPAAAHTDEGQATLDFRSFVSGYEILLEADQVCDFEAQVAWVAGLASPNGFRAFELADPPRLVVDVKH